MNDLGPEQPRGGPGAGVQRLTGGGGIAAVCDAGRVGHSSGPARLALRRLLFPGLNLHARLRYRRIPPKLGSGQGGQRLVIDAGCGNGMLSYQAYLRGSTVRGITVRPDEAEKAKSYFNGFLGIDPARLIFDVGNLYDVEFGDSCIEEIICTEVLEHVRRDDWLCRKFWVALKPGGVLHITAPNADHPYNRAFPLDPDEGGGHVRAGYTPSEYRALLGSAGFQIEAIEPLGGPVRQFFNRRIKEIQARLGPAAGLPLFLFALPFLVFENRRRERACPFAYYVRAVKRLDRAVDAAAAAAQNRVEHRIGSVAAG